MTDIAEAPATAVESLIKEEGNTPSPTAFDMDAEIEAEIAAGPPDLSRMARVALAWLNRAVSAGRAAEAASWMRTWRALKVAAAEMEAETTTPLETKATTKPSPPEPMQAFAVFARDVECIARDVADLDRTDHGAVRRMKRRFETLDRRAVALGLPPFKPAGSVGRISDDSDPIFSPSPPPFTGEDKGPTPHAGR
ncbi:hypothetical protein [Brevundimonas faecalis]|uniref:Uncharacterized protein n=1 Tax=Brevundimonas faecalis TaxID=947378 RepID=A0ABV2RB75_9CAUL